MVDPRLKDYYDGRFVEADRLRTREGQLEFERTKDLLRRYLPPSGARIIDVGGGTGAYAAWLASSGHTVRLVDIVQSHVDAAAAIGTFSAEVGDARSLRDADESHDVALLMGPMYHLPDRTDRLRALSEARRVVRRNGLVAVSYVSRLAVPLDAFVKGWIYKERGLVGLDNAVRHGHDVGGGFGAIAYFHLPSEIKGELEDGCLEPIDLFGVEGPGWIAADFESRWSEPTARQAMLDAARACERTPEILSISAHLLAFARRGS